jgi:peptide deformylase
VRIVKYPHPALRHISKPLLRVDSGLKAMVRQMLDLMYAQEGVGLAANQVELPYRLIVMNIKSDPAAKEEEHVFINPVITARKGLEEKEEGCLSLPQINAPVKRSQKITVNAYDLAGQEITWELDGTYARVVQHECDHLDGILFIDRLSPANFLAIKQDLLDLEAEFAGDRRLGLIPEDQLITARLSELELART